MTLDEFEHIIKRKTDSQKYFNYCICWTLISFSLYMLVAEMKNIKDASGKLGFTLSLLIIILVCVYTIWVLKNKHKVKIWYNSLTKEQNSELIAWLLLEFNKTRTIPMPGEDHIVFFYQKYWLTLSYSIHLFADKNRIAIHADSTQYSSNGMIDLGASKRLQNKILAMMEERSSTYLSNP